MTWAQRAGAGVPATKFQAALAAKRSGRQSRRPVPYESLRHRAKSQVSYLQRHLSGDWGIVKPEDRRKNEHALRVGLRMASGSG
jgi:hypothetical protein